jgi:hypothetical protein
VEEGGDMTDLRPGQYVYIRAKVVSTPAEQWGLHKELAVMLVDAKGNPVSEIQHGIEDRRAVLTLPEAIRALERMGK